MITSKASVIMLVEALRRCRVVPDDYSNANPTWKKPDAIEASDNTRRHLKIWFRTSVICILFLTGAFFGCASYYVYAEFEDDASIAHFEDMAHAVSGSASIIVKEKKNLITAAAAVVAMMCPSAAQWPNCSIPVERFEAFSSSQSAAGALRAVSFAPIVRPDKLTEFEAFAYEFYNSSGHPEIGLSNFTGGPDLQRGVYGRDVHNKRYRVTGPASGSANDFITPVFMIGPFRNNKNAIMFDLYQDDIRRPTIDYVVKCAGQPDCFASTDFIQLVQDGAKLRPAALIMSPIVIESQLVGILSVVVNWDCILNAIVPTQTSPAVAVLFTDTASFSFEVGAGKPKLLGHGDLHDTSVKSRSFIRDDMLDDGYGMDVFVAYNNYTMKLYVTDEWMKEGTTSAPIVSSVISVFVILITTLVVFIHDYFMNKDLVEQAQILTMKRDFVRYISHEIRTPMNTVYLGMKILSDEMRSEKVDASTKLSEWIQIVSDVTDSMNNAIGILNDLINYDKVTLGVLKLDVGELNICDLVQETVKPFIIHAQLLSISLNLKFDFLFSTDTIVVVEGDKMKLTQVFRNLISNALKFTKSGGVIELTGMYICI